MQSIRTINLFRESSTIAQRLYSGIIIICVAPVNRDYVSGAVTRFLMIPSRYTSVMQAGLFGFFVFRVGNLSFISRRLWLLVGRYGGSVKIRLEKYTKCNYFARVVKRV